MRITGNNATAGDYTLTVYGASGALPAFTVTATNPPANSYNKPFSSITVDFNDSILLSSLSTANLTCVPSVRFLMRKSFVPVALRISRSMPNGGTRV